MQATPTKLSIDRWARIMGINPAHFWGVTLPIQMLRSTCDTPWFQFDWQDSERTGREEVARAIAEAESDIEHIIGYRLLPSWEADEWQATIRPYRREMFNMTGTDIRGMAQTIAPRWGYFISGGIRAKTVLGTGVAVGYANTMPPTGYKNQATATFNLATAIPDCEIGIYYPGMGGDDQWRIIPAAISHIGLAYTAVWRREQGVIPDDFDSYDLENLRGVDGTVDADFITEVDVYRVYNDPSQQATMMWEPFGETCGVCSGTGCPSCAYAVQTACLIARGDPRIAQVGYRPADWDASAQTFNPRPFAAARQPDVLRLWYYSGWQDKTAVAQGAPGVVSVCPQTEMDDQWARIVAHFAASKLERPPCACTTKRWEHWAQDLAFASGAEELAAYNLRTDDLGNPLGTRRGAVEAWHRLLRPGVSIGRVAIDR